MKITIKQLRRIVTEVVAETMAGGKIQQVYRNSFKSMVKLASKGGEKNSPPYTKAPTVGKSGTPGNP
jgi:hypothetical protein|tara:strand:+ start:456 stop:656 length:201 start_codon:yes stop_codon:yes gene_type:complete